MNGRSLSSTLFAMLPLLVGGGVYVFWRSPSLLMFRWFDGLGLAPFVALLRDTVGSVADHVPGWILYSWPDAAWTMSGVMLFAFIWQGSQSNAKHVWILLAPVIAIVSEMAQWLRLLPGTFDPVDLAACGLATLAGVLAASRLYAYEL